ncbi:MAG TPA: hypothetical protein PLV61_02000, partial [Parvularculaceae bacterium]|nr:hypothetical protein [Parvularculaceae bacterium]
IDLHNEWRYWPALLNAALLRAFAGKREILRDYPVEVLGSEKRNFITHPDLPDWVQKRSLLQFTPRTLFSGGGKPVFGLLCDVRVRDLLLASCADLLKLGLTPIGHYVLVDEVPRDMRLAPRSILVGRVRDIADGILRLDDCREGYDEVAAVDARLSADIATFNAVVRQLIPGQAERVLAASKTECASAIHCGPGRLGTLTKTLEFLRGEALEAAPGLSFKFGDFIGSKSALFPSTEVIKRPALLFNPAGTHSDTWNERGIKNYGPYDQRSFTPKRLNVAVICQARYEGQVEAFVAKFLDGMPEVKTGQRGKETARYADGFLRRFQLERANVRTFTSPDATMAGYKDACLRVLEHAANENAPFDLALVQIEEEFKSLPGATNPYYGTKALLLKNHVAVQSFRLETIEVAAKDLVFTMNQISLASYAKLGGRPWLLNADLTVGHELIIGVGSHYASEGRLGGGKRHVGITTVFSSDGTYHLSERTNAVAYDEYTGALTETLTRTINRVREVDNWRSSDRVRLIFHMFKPARDLEAEAIKNAVAALDLSNVVYAFLHVAPSHPFVIFDLDQKGLPQWAQEKKGVLGPSRGVHLKLNDYESLVVFGGASELKQATDGLPRACLLKLHRNSTFRDMTYLARQAFDFTAHSWRIMFPEAFPITIKYSDLIAERLTGLKEIPDWDDDAIRFRDIGRTPWFL